LLGDGIKRPSLSELRNLNGIRRGVVAARELPKGTVITQDMLAAKRPFSGIEPEQLPSFVGYTLKKTLREDEPIHWYDIQ
jgi:sialic acid synthase SpsE